MDVVTDSFLLRDNDDAAITGKVAADFIALAAYQTDTPGTTAPVTITEIGSGQYEFSFTPSTLETWSGHVRYDSNGVDREFLETYPPDFGNGESTVEIINRNGPTIHSISDLGKGPPATGNLPIFTSTGWRNDLPAHGLDIRAFGATGAGANDSVAMQAAIDAAVALGGGTIRASAGDFGFTGTVLFPQGVNLMGAGNGKTGQPTRFRALSADARIAFGARGTDSRGGASGNFSIDGNNLATNPMVVGRCVQRTFSSIDIHDAAAGGAGLLIEEGQNNRFDSINIEDCDGDGLVFDRGCGGNIVIGLEISGIGGRHLAFVQSAVTALPLYAEPNNNLIIGAVIERTTGTTTALLYHGAGAYNELLSPDFAVTTGAAAVPIIKMRKDGAQQSTRLLIRDPYCFGQAATTTGVDITGACNLQLMGRMTFQSLLRAFYLDDSCVLDIWGRAHYVSVTDKYVNQGGVRAFDAVYRQRTDAVRESTRYSTSEYSEVSLVSGDAGVRFWLRADGALQWRDGSDSVPDTTLQRYSSSGVGGLALDKPFRGTAIWGTAVVTKTGAYVTTLSDEVILADATAGAFTVTLASAVGLTGKHYTIKRTSAANNVTVDPNGTQTIDGALTKVLGSQYAAIDIRSDGANWQIISQLGTVS